MIVILILFVAILSTAVGAVAGITYATRVNMRTELRSLGLSAESVNLLRRAARLFDGMVSVSDLNGDFTILDRDTRATVNTWLAEYRSQSDL